MLYYVILYYTLLYLQKKKYIDAFKKMIGFSVDSIDLSIQNNGYILYPLNSMYSTPQRYTSSSNMQQNGKLKLLPFLFVIKEVTLK